MKKLLAIVLTAVMALTAVACSSGSAAAPAAETQTEAQAAASTDQSQASGKLAEILAKGKIVVATDAAWAPFEYIGKEGEVTGSDLEIGKYIAQQLGVECEIINVAFDSLSTYLANNECDLAIAAMTITDERKETVDFSSPYTVACQYIIVPETDTATSKIEDLAGKSVGVHLGTTGDFLVSDEALSGCLAGTGTEVKQYKFLTDACLAMNNGELGAIVCDTLLAKNLVATNKGLKCFELVYGDGTKTDEEYGIAMAKGDPEFVKKINEIIDPIIKDGTIDGWILKHTELASEIN